MPVVRGFPENPAHRVPMDRLEDVESDEAYEYVKAKRPFVARVPRWKTDRWTIDYLKQAVGHIPFPLIDVETNERLESTTSEVMDLMKDPYWRRKVMPESGGGPLVEIHGGDPHPESAVLAADYNVPRFIPDHHAAQVLLRSSGVVEEGEYYHTPPHWEYDANELLILQVQGKKHVFLFDPREAPHLGVTSELPSWPFLSVGAHVFDEPINRDLASQATCLEVVMEPGDILFIPEFWFHWFIHYPVTQLNLRFIFPPQEVLLSPVSAAWAFANALAEALGGFADIEDRYNALPAPVRELIVAVEENLTTCPWVTRPRDMYQRRFSDERRETVAKMIRQVFKATGGQDPVGAIDVDDTAE